MRSLGYAIVACSVLSLGSTAQAQSISAVGVGDAYANVGNRGTGWDLEDREGTYTRGVNRGASVEVKVDISPSTVRFESGVAVGGKGAGATSNSGVDVTLTNTGEGAVTIDKFRSTIIPAGLGFYLQDKNGSPTAGLNEFTGFGQTESGYTFSDLFAQVGANSTFASASFNFYITNGESTLYTLNGLLSLSFDADGNLIVNDNLNGARNAMPSMVTAYDNGFALAYAWDATNLTLDLNAYLQGGQSTTLEYRTTVEAFSGVDCISGNLGCLVAYSGFGDPIGRGGGVAEARMARGIERRIDGIVFDPQDVVVYGAISGAVPEPATWAMMIMGFGAMGAALRRRRGVSYS